MKYCFTSTSQIQQIQYGNTANTVWNHSKYRMEMQQIQCRNTMWKNGKKKFSSQMFAQLGFSKHTTILADGKLWKFWNANQFVNLLKLVFPSVEKHWALGGRCKALTMRGEANYECWSDFTPFGGARSRWCGRSGHAAACYCAALRIPSNTPNTECKYSKYTEKRMQIQQIQDGATLYNNNNCITLDTNPKIL